jgi:MFS transporter, UMF1 family
MESPPQAATPPAAPGASHPHVITRRAVVSWVLYDLANTIFSMGVVSLFFSLWVRDMVGEDRADSVYGLITAISMGLIFVASPTLGALTDRAPRRMPFLVVSTVICVVCTALFARLGYWPTVVLFIVANIAYQAGLQFYDAMLPEVSTEANRGRIGGVGVGVGYLGSYLAVGLGLLLPRLQDRDDKPLYFLLVAGMFLLFALPCFLFVRERGNPNPRRITLATIVGSTRETIRTLRSGQQYPGLLRFLIGRVFYTDPINTVISFMSLYTVNVAMQSGLDKVDGEQRAKVIMMSAITFAVLGGFFWGWLTDRLGPKRTLNLVLKAWMAIFLLAALVGILALPLWTMYVVAATAGFSLGGVWAADRPYMLRLTPPSRIGEFYGLYGMVGRFSAVTGPVLWAVVFELCLRGFKLSPLASQGVAILTLLALMGVSYVILQPVTDEPRDWSKLEHPGGAAAADSALPPTAPAAEAPAAPLNP